MQTYRDYSPTGFDTKGLNGDEHGIAEFRVLCGQNRDSGTIDRSNFRSALRALGGESDTVQVHRFGHWACGWFELLLVDPSDVAALETATEIHDSLQDYPIVDESDHSDLEYQETADYWAQMSVRERVEHITRANTYNEYTRVSSPIPVFAARRDELPEDPAGRLFEHLTAGSY